MENLEKLCDIIFGDYKVVVITGAGISTLSGIADFRGKDGLYTRGENVGYLMSIKCFEKEPDKFYEFYRNNLMVENLEPNIIHNVLAKLEERGLIDRIITQNIDSLHTKAGSKRVIELHGSGDKFYCTNCGVNHSFSEYKESCKCKECGGMVRPDIALYGENIKLGDSIKARQAVINADKVVVLGSSISVGTVRNLLLQFMNHKSDFTYDDIFIVNANPTCMDCCARTCSEDLGEVFKKILTYDKK